MSENRRTIDPGDAGDLYCRDDGSPVGEWVKAGEQFIDEHRWYDEYWLVLRHEDGTYWGLQYEVGKTEMQETTMPWKGTHAPLSLTRLYPHEVTGGGYRTTPAVDG